MKNMDRPNFSPEPAESFEAEFLNVKGEKVRKAMLEIGDFSFRSSGPKDLGAVYFIGERSDGSKITIIIEEGDNYKSPAELSKSIEKIKSNKQEIIEAVKLQNIEDLISALKKINKQLLLEDTGHFSTGAGINELKKEISDFFNEAKKYGDASMVVYLGDGGISRLVIDLQEKDKINLALTDNSSQEVKEKWEEIQ